MKDFPKKILMAKLKEACPDLDLSSDPGVLESHGQDWTRFRKPAPVAVAFPESVEQVIRLVKVAAQAGISLVPSGGRTGLSGGAVAAQGEVVVSFDRMRRVLDFDPVDRTVLIVRCLDKSSNEVHQRASSGTISISSQSKSKASGPYRKSISPSVSFSGSHEMLGPRSMSTPESRSGVAKVLGGSTTCGCVRSWQVPYSPMTSRGHAAG